MSDDTLAKRPLPARPETGWKAWEATVGYISNQHSPDATLKIETTLQASERVWAASLEWGAHREAVTNRASLMAALRELWFEIDMNHKIFDTMDAAVRQPKHYDDHEWFDEKTQSVLDRLMRMIAAVFGDDWHLIIIYQPVERPDMRVQARILAKDNSVQRGGSGPTIREACRNLYQNLAAILASNLRRED